MAVSDIQSAWRLAFAPPDLRPIHEWARDGNVICHPPLTKHGPLDVSDTRHFIAPLDALSDDWVREVNVQAPVRSGKTLLGDAFLCHVVKRDPGPFRASFQDDQIAGEHAETRTWKMLGSLPGFRDLLPADRFQNRRQEIIMPHMPLYMQGPALGKMQSKGFRFMWLDECWLYRAGIIEEAKGRLGDYEKLGLSKLLCTSQGGVMDDDWDRQFSSGELNEWVVACPKCGQYQAPGWSVERPEGGAHWGLVWDEKLATDGSYDIEACKATVRYECQHCGHMMLDGPQTRGEWNRTGRYDIVGQQKRDKKSFHWSAIIDFPWARLLELYLEARNYARAGVHKYLIIFVQKRMAERYDPARWTATERLPAAEIDLQWEGEKFRFLTIDVQELEYWVVVRAWGTNESRLLWAGKLRTQQEVEDKQAEFKVKDACVFVDCSYNRRAVYEWAAKHNRRTVARGGKTDWVGWKCLDGEQRAGKQFVWTNPKTKKRMLLPYSYPPKYADPYIGGSQAGKHFCKVFLWDNDYIKGILDAYRDGTAPGVKWLAYKGVDEAWNQHQFGERRVRVVNKYGQPQDKYERIGKRRCDLRDCEAMQLVAASQAGIVGEGVE